MEKKRRMEKNGKYRENNTNLRMDFNEKGRMSGGGEKGGAVGWINRRWVSFNYNDFLSKNKLESMSEWLLGKRKYSD